MFLFNYRYRLKCIFNDRQLMFWTFLFPVLLATLFNLAFSNLSNAEEFIKVNVAVVQSQELDQNPAFTEAINGNDELFVVQYTTRDEADTLLNDNQIDGYVVFDPELGLVVNRSGLNQTIIREFLNDFLQSSATITTIITENPAALNNGILTGVSSRTEYLRAVSASQSNPDPVVNYFYTLIAMTCLYGGFLGVKEVVAIQADLSAVGARVNLAPTNKLTVFLSSMLAATSVLLLELLLLLAFLTGVLGISFGNQLFYIALTCVVGSLTGVSFGACIAAIIKKGEGVIVGILIGSTMTMSFLAGMMSSDIKYLVMTKVPILSYLNPASLITDSFYALYYYNTHTQFFTNLLLLGAFTLLFSTITYLVLRRQKYASL
ncbi:MULTISPECIES: ABC transporter permease [unclassified Acetobacterium]|jgi:ABC-2 type transport system permease protein|uniref:ABC transporter permease n=1 Tax=unclassified Acetobacterium TaxID=2638182 RepID=UPI000DBEAD29|nr:MULTISPECIES: ABC transporter permease [unclassified Acetobacterium]AWW27738.1 ABC transporter permease [Acetobacterium sp. KB-1]MDZ5725946.1 ABC transporter permease [Acetobacterium sp. K1/6]